MCVFLGQFELGLANGNPLEGGDDELTMMMMKERLEVIRTTQYKVTT